MMHIFKQTAAVFSVILLSAAYMAPQSSSGDSGSTSVITATSTIDWTKNRFYSTVLLDTEKAGILLPSGKNTAVNRISRDLPKLLKDQLLSLAVDSSQNLGDLVIGETVTLAQLTEIIDHGTRTPGVFADSGVTLRTDHSISLLDISAQMIRHEHSYEPDVPMESISSRPYSGIIIDARGKLEVQGEFITDIAKPCFFPQIWDTDMNLVYERNMEDSTTAKTQGIVAYDYSDNENRYRDRVGSDPMHIIAHRIYGRNRTDPVISHEDALRILTVPENRRLFTEGKVVVLLDKDQLIHAVSAPQKDEAYYVAYNNAGVFLYKNKVTGVTLQDTYKGILVQLDLKFVADSPKLLPEESGRISKIAELLKQITQNNEFTILVEGHTADVGKPEGQMNLSILRAQAVIEALVANGVPKDIFTFKGYGGTKSVASNATPEGRAQNRRVDITARPKATYIQSE